MRFTSEVGHRSEWGCRRMGNRFRRSGINCYMEGMAFWSGMGIGR